MQSGLFQGKLPAAFYFRYQPSQGLHLLGKGLNQGEGGQGFLEPALDPGFLLHVLMTQEVNLGGKETDAKQEARKDDQDYDREPPFQVKEKDHSPDETQPIPGQVDYPAGEKPAKTLNIGGQAGHQVPVSFGHRRTWESRPLEKAVLEVEEDSCSNQERIPATGWQLF
jgi:hypothetical protein